MDTGLTAKPPAATTAQTGAVRTDAVQSRDAVPTELAASKTVNAIPQVEAPSLSPARREAFARDVIIDPHSREVIFRVVDVRSRQVVRQVPEQALLRIRAYARALADGETMPEAVSKADLKV